MRRVHAGLLIVVALLVAACGAARAPEMDRLQSGGAPPPEPMAVEESAAVDGGGNGIASVPEQRMIIYNGALDLIVKDTVATEEEIGGLMDELDGHILTSESYRQSETDLLQINMTLRVPAESFNTAMARLREMALEVTRERISSEDVTQEYVDLESRLTALEAKADKLEELMDQAEDTEAVLQVYAELSATQEEIEHVKGRMRYLQRSAAMATIDVSLTPDAVAQPLEVAGWRPQGTAKRALQALINAYQFLINALIWIIILVVPVLLGIGLVIFLLVKLIQWLFFRRKKKRRAEQTPPSGA